MLTAHKIKRPLLVAASWLSSAIQSRGSDFPRSLKHGNSGSLSLIEHQGARTLPITDNSLRAKLAKPMRV